MRPEFKVAMDSYEAFYDEYCDIMRRYTENPSDMELFTNYANMLTKAAEMSEKFEAWEDNEISQTPRALRERNLPYKCLNYACKNANVIVKMPACHQKVLPHMIVKSIV